MNTRKNKKNLIPEIVYKECSIPCVNLSEKDIQDYKLNSTKTKNNNSKDNEPAQKKLKMNTNRICDSKLVLSSVVKTDTFKSQFKSSLKHNKEIASTSTNIVTTEIDCPESTESVNSSASQVRNKLSVIDSRKLMNDDKLKLYMNTTSKNFMYKKNKLELPRELSLNKTKLNDNYIIENIFDIEKLYKKYFSKSRQDTIVTIANILDIILIFNKHNRAQIDEDINKIHLSVNINKENAYYQLQAKNKKILETILNKHFIDDISSFADLEFKSVFQMFFLSILNVFRALDHSKSKEVIHFDDLALLLMNSLKNSEFHQSKLIFSMFQSWEFQSACINIFRVIENSRRSDPRVIDRLPIFFVSTVNRKYFQIVIDTLINNYNRDLASLINNAHFQCSINSIFKDPVDLSTKKQSKDKRLVTKAIQIPINSDKKIQHRAKHPDGTLNNLVQVTASSSGIVAATETGTLSTVITVPQVELIQSNKSTVNVLRGDTIDGRVISVGNQLYEIIKAQPLLIESQEVDSDMLVDMECYPNHCNNDSTIICNFCSMVSDCSITCKRCD